MVHRSTIRAVGRRVGQGVHDAPAAASVLWRHLGHDPISAASITLRAVPTPLRELVLRHTRVDRGPVTRALALAAAGERDDAVSTLAAGSAHARPHQLRRVIAAAAALEEPDLALRLLDRLPPDDVDRDRLLALIYHRQGWLRAADAAAARAGRRGHKLRRRILGELTVLTSPPPRGSSEPGVTVPTPSPSSTPPSEGADANRVLHLVTNALPEVTAGYTIRTQGIVAAQREVGVDAHVATRLGFPVTSGVLGAPAEVEVDGVPYHRLLPMRWLPTTGDAALALDVDLTTDLVRRLSPDVLHAHSKHVNAQVAIAVRERTGIPVVYEVRGFLEETWRSRGHDVDADAYRFARDIETSCMFAADHVVTIAESMRTEMVARGVPAERVSVVPNAVSEAFLAPPPDPTRLRSQLGFAPDDVVVGVVTTLNAYEGVDVLVDAVALLHAEGAPVRLLVVGGGSAADSLATQIERLGLDRVAVMTGRVPHADIRTYHAALDVFCVPRLSTPVTRLVPPLKPLEALATGRPVVASDLPPLAEIVQEGVSGALFQPGDAADLAAVLRSLVYDSPRRRLMGRTGRDWVRTHRTWTASAARYRAVYHQITGPHLRPELQRPDIEE